MTSPLAPGDAVAALRAAATGRYEIEREIGQGAFATVYLAHDRRHERRVELKVLNADSTSEVGELRFIREIRLLAGLQHPRSLPLDPPPRSIWQARLGGFLLLVRASLSHRHQGR